VPATLAQAVPAGAQWAYEIKHDGFRFICRRDTLAPLKRRTGAAPLPKPPNNFEIAPALRNKIVVTKINKSK
jgi:hypothetical protein